LGKKAREGFFFRIFIFLKQSPPPNKKKAPPPPPGGKTPRGGTPPLSVSPTQGGGIRFGLFFKQKKKNFFLWKGGKKIF